MKKIFKSLILASLLFVPSLCFAQLYLGVDPDPDVFEYMIEFDGNTMGPMPPFEIEADVVKIMDIEAMVVMDTQHTIRAAAVNAWGDVSEWSDPFEFMLTETGGVVERQIPAPPASLRLLSE